MKVALSALWIVCPCLDTKEGRVYLYLHLSGHSQ